MSNKDIPRDVGLTNAARTSPRLKRKTVTKMAFPFFILPDGKGLFGLSSLSTFISNRSFKTRPPTYKKIDEKIKMTRSEIPEPVDELRYTDTARKPTIMSGGTVKTLEILKSWRYGL